MEYVLVIWLGMFPNYFGQYETKAQCWSVSDSLVTVGVGAEEPIKFQCIEVETEKG